MQPNEQQPIQVEAVETTTVAEGEAASAPCPPAVTDRKYRHINGELVSRKSFLIRLAIGLVALTAGIWIVYSGYYG